MASSKPHTNTSVEGLPEEMLAGLSGFIAAHMGLNFPRKRWRDLERGIISAACEFGFDEPESFARWIVSSPLSREQIEVLASHLTVGETYFLREKRVLEILKEDILPRLLRARGYKERSLRIWSVGCSSGEEPFSIAILFNEMDAFLREWNISILATDINPHALCKATKGVYGEWSFRNVSQSFKEKYFRKSGGGRYEILPQIRRMVNFSYLNIAEDSYPSLANNTNAMDLIFCRNMLMYFTPDLAKNVVERLYRSLVDGGWLIVSPCETSALLFSKFKTVNFTDAILYRKQGSGVGGRGSVKPHQITPMPLTADIQTAAPIRQIPIPRSQAPDPRPPAPYEEAMQLYEQGHYTEAEERLAAFTPAHGEEVEATLFLCRVLANRGKLTEARDLLEQSISTHKLETGLHYLLAMVLEEQGNLDEAAGSLRRAIYLDQNLVLAHFSLANLALRQGKENEARKHFANTLALLERLSRDEIIPGSEGMSAGRLLEIVRTMGMM